MRTTLPHNNFIEKLKNNEFHGNEIGLADELIIDASIVNWEFRTIRNVTFEEIVKVSNVNIKSGLFFLNCNFKKGIQFINVKSKGFNPTINPDNSSLKFDNCISNFINISEDCFFERNVVFCNDCKIEKVNIQNTIIVNAGFSIKNSTIKYLDIFNSIFEVNFTNSSFLKPIRIKSLKGDIAFVSNEFAEWLRFRDIECDFSFTLNKNTFKDKFTIEGSKIKGIFIHGDTFEKKAVLENRDLSGENFETYLNEVYITEAKFIEGFAFNGLGKSIEKITLPITPLLQGVLKFEGWLVDNTYISGVNQNLKILFKRISFRFFVINDFTNYSDISFDKCNGYDDCTFNLSDCDLGATKFNEFDFNTFIKLRFDNVTLDKIKPTNNKWFEDDALEIEIAEQTETEKYRRRREVYRQIKQALKSNGNQIDSLIFQAREMKAYRNEKKESGNYSLGDKIIMSVSQTNNYGLDWMKPLGFIFFITLGFYIIALPLFSNKLIYCTNCYWDGKLFISEIYERFGVYWQLLNPTRKFESTYGKFENGWLYALDLLHRIILGILIFQTIKAFRKFISS